MSVSRFSGGVLRRISGRATWLVAAACLSGCTTVVDVSEGTSYQSPSGKRTARISAGQVFVDGAAPIGKFDLIARSGVQFSPDESVAAYSALRGQEWFLVVDSTVHGPYVGVGENSPVFSPAGKRMAFSYFKREDEWFVWVDGKTHGPYEGVGLGSLQYSHDGRRVSWTVLQRGRWFPVVDGERIGTGSRSLGKQGVLFTRDNLPVYLVFEDGVTFVQIGNWRSEPFDNVLPPGIHLSTDRSIVAYAGRRKGLLSACFDTRCDVGYKMVGATGYVPAGSNTSGILAASLLLAIANTVAPANRSMFVPGGGTKAMVIESSFQFSGNGRHVAYPALDESYRLVLDAKPVATLPSQALFESIGFNETSEVAFYTVAGSEQVHAVATSSARPRPAEAEGSSASRISASEGSALVFVDGAFAGVSPVTLQLADGDHAVRVEKPGYLTTEQRFTQSAGRGVEVKVEMRRSAALAAVVQVLTSINEPALLMPPKITPLQLWKARGMCRVPMHEPILAVLDTGDDDACLAFGVRGVHVWCYRASECAPTREQFVPYAALAGQEGPKRSLSYTVPIMPAVLFNTTATRLPADKLTALFTGLRTQVPRSP